MHQGWPWNFHLNAPTRGTRCSYGKHKLCVSHRKELRLLILSSASCSYNRDDEDVIKAIMALYDLQHQPQLNISWLQFLLPHLSGGMTPCLLLVRFICETDNDWETWEFTVSIHPAFPLLSAETPSLSMHCNVENVCCFLVLGSILRRWLGIQTAAIHS